jgi:hypothetical protein
MKRFELEKIAKQIVQQENIIMNKSSSKEDIQKAENEIFKITAKYNLNLFDMIEIDEIVQNMLQ